MEKPPQLVLGYARCSTTEQAESGLGIAAQEATIRSECQRRGWELVEVLTDEGELPTIFESPHM